MTRKRPHDQRRYTARPKDLARRVGPITRAKSEPVVSHPTVPRLATANTGPLLALEQKIVDEMPAIERWFRLQWQEHTPPFYGSVDLRNAGYKLAPVDMNLFPGGFNNLSDGMLQSAVQAAQSAI